MLSVIAKRDNLERLASEIAAEYELPPKLVFAVIEVESNWNPNACRYEPGFNYFWNVEKVARENRLTVETVVTLQRTSHGLMQVMGSVAYEHGLAKEENPIERIPTALYNPWLGIVYGCKHLALKLELYGPEPADVYAAYNAGSVRIKKNNEYVNQKNVDHFLRIYNRL